MSQQHSAVEPQRIRPASYQPPRGARRKRALPGPAVWLVLPVGVLLAVGLWFVFTIRAVPLEITPQPNQLQLSGFTLNWGQRLLARPGEYTLNAQLKGYKPLVTTLNIPSQGDVNFQFQLEPLPGRVTIHSVPVTAQLTVDGESLGYTPAEELLLSTGEHELQMSADGYEFHEQTIAVTGLDRQQVFTVELLPQAPVTFSSIPSGAELTIDDEVRGQTDLLVRLDPGTHEVSLSKNGYQTWRETIDIPDRAALILPTVELQKAEASLRLTSQPEGARISINGRQQGVTPLRLDVAAASAIAVQFSLPGYRNASRSITIPANAERTLNVELKPILGEVAVRAEPPDAHVFVNGRDLGAARQILRLPATETELVFRRAGYADLNQRVTPDPQQRQELNVALTPNPRAVNQKHDEFVDTPSGQRLRLVLPGRFVMGAARGQQGRRANEVQRQVELTRPYYIATREISNAEFRAFEPRHSSGIISDKTLDNDKQPVVRISWQQAAAYCNWLSQREGLRPAYEEKPGGRLHLTRPVGLGYRLPSEAEWAYAARFAGGRDLKYPWGANMPPTEPTGNFADLRARELVSPTIPYYDDSWAATAPVGALTPNALGIHDLGGNVSEWMNDFYSSGLDAGLKLERDPRGPLSGSAHTIRGSSWRHASITELRLSWRDQSDAGRDDLGFRIVRYAE